MDISVLIIDITMIILSILVVSVIVLQRVLTNTKWKNILFVILVVTIISSMVVIIPTHKVFLFIGLSLGTAMLVRGYLCKTDYDRVYYLLTFLMYSLLLLSIGQKIIYLLNLALTVVISLFMIYDTLHDPTVSEQKRLTLSKASYSLLFSLTFLILIILMVLSINNIIIKPDTTGDILKSLSQPIYGWSVIGLIYSIGAIIFIIIILTFVNHVKKKAHEPWYN